MVLLKYLPPEGVFGLREVLSLLQVVEGCGGEPVILEYEEVEGQGFFSLAEVLGHCCWPESFTSSFPFAGQGPEDLGSLFMERGIGDCKATAFI